VREKDALLRAIGVHRQTTKSQLKNKSAVFVKPIDGGGAYYVQSSNELSDLSSELGEINSSRDAALENN